MLQRCNSSGWSDVLRRLKNDAICPLLGVKPSWRFPSVTAGSGGLRGIPALRRWWRNCFLSPYSLIICQSFYWLSNLLPKIPKSCFWALKPVGYLCLFLKTQYKTEGEKENHGKNEREKAGLGTAHEALQSSNPSVRVRDTEESLPQPHRMLFSSWRCFREDFKINWKFPFISSFCRATKPLLYVQLHVRDVGNR